jgi:hypothetical protein
MGNSMHTRTLPEIDVAKREEVNPKEGTVDVRSAGAEAERTRKRRQASRRMDPLPQGGGSIR